jgi:thiosulfate reductase cytochrome b subunit
MSLATATVIVLFAVWPATASGPALAPPDLGRGLQLLWHPAMMLLLQALWLGYFLHTGRSTVTGSVLSFHVRRERV